MSHESSSMLSSLHGFGDNILLLAIIPVVIVLFIVYKKFGTDSHGYGREGIFEKLEHRVVKTGVAVTVAALVLGGAYILGFI